MNDYDQLKTAAIRMFLDDMSTAEIHRKTGVPIRTIQRWVLPERRRIFGLMEGTVRGLLLKGVHQAAIARIMKVSQSTVYRLIDKCRMRGLVLSYWQLAKIDALPQEPEAIHALQNSQEEPGHKREPARGTGRLNAEIRAATRKRDLYLAITRIIFELDFLVKVREAKEVEDSILWRELNAIAVPVLAMYADIMLEPFQQGDLAGRLLTKMVSSLQGMDKGELAIEHPGLSQNHVTYNGILKKCRMASKTFDRILSSTQAKGDGKARAGRPLRRK